MCDVYQNCEFCLAAPGSASPGSGLYSVDSVPTERFCVSSNDIHGSNSKSWDVYGREPLSVSHNLLKDPDTVEMHDPERNPKTLRFRGWVFQERMLAPRTIQFLKHELSWDCRKETACECGMMSQDVGFEGSMGQKKIKFFHELQTIPSGRHATRWREVVSSYTSLYLTQESDRLPAIAGVTRMFEKARGSGSTCHAGVWSDTAAQDLSWRVLDRHLQKKLWTKERLQTRIPGQPTWSWASVYAAVNYFAGVGYQKASFDPLCEVIEMGPSGLIPKLDANQTNPQSQDLVIQGQLLPAELCSDRESYLEDSRDAKAEVRYSYALRFRGERGKWPFHEDDDLNHIPGDTTVFCLALGKYWLDRITLTRVMLTGQCADKFDRYDCLVLLPVGDASKNTYRRIGMIDISRQMWPRDINQSTVRIC